MNTDIPWLVGGDFNTILNESEKLGGLPVTQSEVTDFAQCICTCALNEIKFTGSCYTWWNGRIEEASIFKRLDRVFGNNDFFSLLPNSETHHLIRQGSDHAPLHVICNTNQEQTVKPFRFLNFWTKHKEFSGIVAAVWCENVAGSPFAIVQTKMKRLKTELTKWSKSTFGNIFQQIATLEDMIRVNETQLEMSPTEANRATLSKANAELKRYLKIEEEYWRQKAGMKWFQDGDRNTKFFHSYVKGRRRKLHIQKYKLGRGTGSIQVRI
uniref:Putative ovule protein n=1 Tax=Solanum chacoense TaxID=4108 RepID=A0A0V0IHV1_SOLCH